MAKLAVLAIHGVGSTERGYSAALEGRLRRELGERAEICFVEIDYQKHLHGNQTRLWERVKGGLRWVLVRKFLLFYFGDAAAVLYNSSEPGSIYRKTQATIQEAAERALAQLEGPECPVVVIAQSLGCQIVSSYLWDAQNGGGIWADSNDDPHTNFLKLGTTKYFITTGCNIPLVVSGLTRAQPIDKPNPAFRWLNFYDADDPLGWPLEQVYSYAPEPERPQARPEDIPVNVGGRPQALEPAVAQRLLDVGAFYKACGSASQGAARVTLGVKIAARARASTNRYTNLIFKVYCARTGLREFLLG